jgi:hypothetical protein
MIITLKTSLRAFSDGTLYLSFETICFEKHEISTMIAGLDKDSGGARPLWSWLLNIFLGHQGH